VGILDFMTIVPYLLMHSYYGITNNDYNNPAILITRMLDIWRLFTLRKFLKFIEDEDRQKLVNNCLIILCLVLCSSGLLDTVDTIEHEDSFYEPAQPFHHTFFFVMTTVSIIGYGTDLTETGPRIAII